MSARYDVRTHLDPRDDEGHLIGRRVSEKRVAVLRAASEASIGDDFFPVDVTECEPARFKIKRHKLGVVTRSPWVLRDRQRPAFVGQYATHALALRAIDNTVRRERGMPDRLNVSVAEIREAMAS